MDLPAILKAVLAPEPDRAANAHELTALRIGDRLTGRVVRLEADGRVLIDLGHFRALAHTMIDVRPGQLLHLQVAQTGVPIQLKLDVQPTSTEPRALPQMAITGILQPDEQQRLIQIIDRILAVPNALADISQAAGQTNRGLQNALLQSAPIPVEKMGTDMPASSSGQATEAVRQAMVALRELFASWPTAGASVNQWTQFIRSVIEDRGILFEIKLAEALNAPAATRQTDQAAGKPENPVNPPNAMTDSKPQVREIMLRDLKPQLLILNGLLNSANEAPSSGRATKTTDSDFLRQAVIRLLAHVEQQQQRAVERADARDPSHVLAHLLSVKDQQQPVRLKVYYPKRGRGGAGAEPGHRIALLLDMDRLGPVRVDLTMAGPELRITFHVRDTDTQHFIEQHTATVALALKGKFDHVRVATQVSMETIARFEHEDTEGSAVGGIDIKA